jgi:DNA repair protein RecO (recombination protein O)
VAGGASRKMRPFLQAGARVLVQWRARTSDQLGSAQLEPVGEGPSSCSTIRWRWRGSRPPPQWPPALCRSASLIPAPSTRCCADGGFEHPDVWPAVFVRFEAGLLQELGFGLDLTRCAATGSPDDLVYVSPRTGRAVSRTAGEPYRDKLLRLPQFLCAAQNRLEPGDVGAGLELTGHFLEQFVFAPLNKPLPAARVWLLDKLRETGRL